MGYPYVWGEGGVERDTRQNNHKDYGIITLKLFIYIDFFDFICL